MNSAALYLDAEDSKTGEDFTAAEPVWMSI